MDVQVDGNLIRSEREKRAWSQEHLAGAAGIGARTIQRIEATGIASYESVRAISAALGISVDRLRREEPSPRRVALANAAPLAWASTGSSLAARWLGLAAALAFGAAACGFLLLEDYQKVRILRTVEVWVTQAQPSAASVDSANRR